MTLDKIIQDVLNQGQREADRIHKSAGKEALVILDRATKEVKALNQEAREQADKEAELVGRKLMSAADLESRRAILQTKADILDRVKKEILDRMRDLPIIDRERHMKKLLAKAWNIIPEGTVRARPQDQDILKANRGSYSIGEPVEITGGIIVESADRTRVLDLSFDTLFEETWEKNFAQISHGLFGGVRS